MQDYLSKKETEKNGTVPSEHNYHYLADWYGELAYTWLRIRHYTPQNDAVKVYVGSLPAK